MERDSGCARSPESPRKPHFPVRDKGAVVRVADRVIPAPPGMVEDVSAGQNSSGIGPKCGSKRPATGWNEARRVGITRAAKLLKKSTPRHKRRRDVIAVIEFRDRPVRRGHARSCCRTGPARGVVPWSPFQRTQRVVGLACISCRQRRLSPKSDTAGNLQMELI
jgi:hypothetical protein